MRFAKLIAGVALALSAPLASAAPVLERQPHLRPPDPGSEEAGLWDATDKAERAARASGELDADPELNAYVKHVLCRVAQEYCDDLRLYVMDRPFFNATAAPNGYVEVWSGLLLRARNEAELAFVLAHETTHFARNHSLAAERHLKDQANGAMALGLILSAGMMAGGAYAGVSASTIANANTSIINISYLGAVVSYFQFSREQEAEADQGGFDRLVAAGYDPNAAASIWQHLIDEHGQSDFDAVRKGHAAGSIFNTHPLDGERLSALAAAAKGKPAGDLGVERYRAAIRPHLTAFLRNDLLRRDFGETLSLIDRLMADGGDAGVLGFYRGECFRLRRGPEDAGRAIKAYEAATTAVDAPTETWRELGDLYVRQHDATKARVAYHAYLDRAPDAQDRWLVESQLKKLDQSEGT